MVYVNASDYLPTTEALGVRIAVHGQREFPFPDTFGFSAPTGFISSFGISMTTVTRMPAPYGTCEKEEDRNKTAFLYKGYEYSTEGCYRSCFQFQMLQECGCGDPRLPLPPGAEACKAADVEGRQCIAEKTEESGGLHGGPGCICNQPCWQKAYGVSFSASRWPADTFIIKECTAATPEECVELYQKNGALLEVYYEQLNYEKLSEKEAYGWVNLIADFGGQLGLWLGISVLTTVEFLVAIYDFIRTFWHYDEEKIKRKETHDAEILASRRIPSLHSVSPCLDVLLLVSCIFDRTGKEALNRCGHSASFRLGDGWLWFSIAGAWPLLLLSLMSLQLSLMLILE